MTAGTRIAPRAVRTAWSPSCTGKRDPLVPSHGTDVAVVFDVERGGHVGGHLAERVLRCANVDRLPVAVEHQHNRFVQYVGHKCLHTMTAPRVWGVCSSLKWQEWLPLRNRSQTSGFRELPPRGASVGQAGACRLCNEARRRASRYG